MATLVSTGNVGAGAGIFNPISSALNGLPNGAGTIAFLWRENSGVASADIGGLTTGTPTTSDWYHALHIDTAKMTDDDGIAGSVETPVWSPSPQPSTWYIVGVAWPAGGPALERHHHVNQQAPAGWTHSNSAGNNGGNRAGPGTSNGRFRIGFFSDNNGGGGYAVAAAWAGVQLSDAQFVELGANNRTSDWWNNSAGRPTLLVECTSTTLTDIGNNPSTFSSIGGLTLTGPDPTWNFDGQGVSVTTNPYPVRHSRETSW